MDLKQNISRKGDCILVAKQIQPATRVETPPLAWLIGVAAWAVPGLGHLVQRRWIRAVLLWGAVWAMFLTGLWLGGHLFAVTGKDQGISDLIQLPPMKVNFGAG